MVLEQIAWAYNIYELNDEEKVMSTKQNTSITKLKGLIKFAGRLYGVLSNQTHLDPSIHNQYLKNTEDKYYVIYSSLRLMNYSLYLFLLIVDIYRIVSEKISNEFIGEFNAWKKNNFGELFLLNNRPLSDDVRQLEEKLFKK